MRGGGLDDGVDLLCEAARVRAETVGVNGVIGSCTRRVGSLYVYLERLGGEFALQVDDAEPMAEAAARAWALGCGAPADVVVRSMANGRVWAARWREDGFEEAGPGPAAFWLRGGAG